MIELYLAAIFILALVVGYELITKVPPTLHTPLMSGTNAISGIIIIAALAIVPLLEGMIALTIGWMAIMFATINVVGGFAVTERMLQMFRKK